MPQIHACILHDIQHCFSVLLICFQVEIGNVRDTVTRNFSQEHIGAQGLIQRWQVGYLAMGRGQA